MPNWNSNKVAIYAPLEEVKKYLVFEDRNYIYFNIPKVFPYRFSADDLLGSKGWDYDWTIENTGTKWFPSIDNVQELGHDITELQYDTAREPNNIFLHRLHKLTDWKIENEYEEP